MLLTLSKTTIKSYELKPYGKFVFKTTSRGRNKFSPNVIVLFELDIYHETAMPLSDKYDEKVIIKMMKENKTDVLINTKDNCFYTRINDGLVQINHTKLEKYRCDEGFKLAVDNGHSFGRKTL